MFVDVAFCISLWTRDDRRAAFDADVAPLVAAGLIPPVTYFGAIDGDRCPPPPWWTAGKGAWGCYRSHLAVIEECLAAGVSSVLVFEDDAELYRAAEVAESLASLPADWGMVYLGGRLTHTKKQPPQQINQGWGKPFGVEATHAYALRGNMLREAYRHLCKRDVREPQHVDHHLARWHQVQRGGLYVPRRWLFRQRAGRSNITGRAYLTPIESPDPETFWTPTPSAPAGQPLSGEPVGPRS
jgi:hypothetical protein